MYKVPKAHQLCTRHELHVMIPNIDDSFGSKTNDKMEGGISSFPPVYSEVPSPSSLESNALLEVVNGLPIMEIIEGIVPEGIRVEVPDRRILQQEGSDSIFIIYFIVYCGEYRALRRSEMDGIRRDLEIEVEKHVALRENRKGKLVSKPFPYAVLDSIVRVHSSQGLFKKDE